MIFKYFPQNPTTLSLTHIEQTSGNQHKFIRRKARKLKDDALGIRIFQRPRNPRSSIVDPACRSLHVDTAKRVRRSDSFCEPASLSDGPDGRPLFRLKR